MIIWSRWGILVVLFAGAGALIGFLIQAVVGMTAERGVTGIFVGIGLVVASVGLYFFDREVMRKRLDKPRPVMLTQAAVTLPDGSVQPARQVPAVNPETGQPVWVQPTSTLFFIPVRFWPYVLAAIGVIVIISQVVALATR